VASSQRDEARPVSGRDAEAVRLRRSPKLLLCPECGSDCVSSSTSEIVSAVRTRVVLRCAECGVSRRLVVTVWGVEAYKRRLDAHRHQIETAIARLEHERGRMTPLRGG
jgi:transcription elongation factor Elf1